MADLSELSVQLPRSRKVLISSQDIRRRHAAGMARICQDDVIGRRRLPTSASCKEKHHGHGNGSSSVLRSSCIDDGDAYRQERFSTNILEERASISSRSVKNLSDTPMKMLKS